jgi:hypothetical protein
MKKSHRNVEFDVHRLEDGRWEWIAYPKLGEGERFAGPLEADEETATAAARAAIDARLGPSGGPSENVGLFQTDPSQWGGVARTAMSNRDPANEIERQTIQFDLGSPADAALGGAGGVSANADVFRAEGHVNARRPSAAPEPLTVAPTPYPADPSAPLVVLEYLRVDRRSVEYAELNAKLDAILTQLRGHNEIAGEVRNQLIAEIQAGRLILASPRPDPNLIKTLLVGPLKYLALAAASGVIGECANEALHFLSHLFAAGGIPL